MSYGYERWKQSSGEGSLREIEYALDVLKADAVGLLTSYGDSSGSKWLGNPVYLPVFEELNRRKAVVFVHPTVPTCHQSWLPDVAPLVTEIPQDTARAITNLLFTGTFARFRDIRFVFAHAGGNVPNKSFEESGPWRVIGKALTVE